MKGQDESLKNGLKVGGAWRRGQGRSWGRGHGSRKMFLNAGSTSVKVFFSLISVCYNWEKAVFIAKIGFNLRERQLNSTLNPF